MLKFRGEGLVVAEEARNDTEIWIIPFDWFRDIDEATKKRFNTDLLGLTQFAQSADKVVHQIKLLGAFGRAYIKIAKNGKKFVIFKGLSGARPTLTGTRYAAENPKIACFVIGAEDILKDAAKGTRVAVIAYVAIDILKECTMDHFSLARLGVNLSSDILQAVIATGAGVAAGAIAGALFVGAAPVVIVFAIVVAVGFAVGLGLNALDQKFHLTDNAVKYMMAMEKDPNSALYKFEHDMSNTGKWLVNTGRTAGGWVASESRTVGGYIASTSAVGAAKAGRIGGWLWQNAEDMAQAYGQQMETNPYPIMP